MPEPKIIEGKARRVLKYDRMFFWYVPLGGVLLAGLAFWGYPSAWPQIGLGIFAGIGIGGVLGVLLRDIP